MRHESLEKLYHRGAFVIGFLLIPGTICFDYFVYVSSVNAWLKWSLIVATPLTYMVALYVLMFVWAFAVFGIGCLTNKDIRKEYLDYDIEIKGE